MSNFYCAAPWRGLHINPQGSIKTCCAGNPHMLGNLNDLEITQALNSPVAQEIRTALSQGQPHAYCSNCVQAERFGAESERHWHNRVNSDIDYSTAGTEYHYPVIVDVRWNTTCNLSCNYCGPTCSSKWASLKKVPFVSGTRSYYDQVCDFIEQHREHIHEVALVGGEPLLLPENNRLLDVISPDAIVTLITNLSVDLEHNKIFQKLAQRTRVGWSMSFDNIGPRLEYVRHGASWDLIQKNLATIKNLMQTQGHWGGIHAVYNIYNATRICEFRQFAQDAGVTVLWQNLFQPDYLDPFLHGPEVAAAAAEEIHKFYLSGTATAAEKVFFDNSLSMYQAVTTARSGIEQEFKQHIQEIENQYHTNQTGKFAQLWPELTTLCETIKITAVDSDNNLFQVQHAMPQQLVQKILNTPWLDLPWQKQPGQESWPRRKIDHDALPWINEWHVECSRLWPAIEKATGTKIGPYQSTAFWIDEPGFTCDMHTDGEMPGSMQLNWIGTKELGTAFYWHKDPAALRYQTFFESNTGYIMINKADAAGYRRLMWHAMLNPVPGDSFRLTSYSVGFA